MMLDEIRGLLRIWALKKEAVKGVKVNDQVKPSWKTGEFWVGAVLPQLPAIVGLFIGASNPITLAVGAACAISYTMFRTQHKTAVAQAAIMAAMQAGAKAGSDAAAAADVPVK